MCGSRRFPTAGPPAASSEIDDESHGEALRLSRGDRRTRTVERIRVMDRTFVLILEGPVPPGRYQVRVWERWRLPWSRPYLRAPILGRNPQEARERAVHVLHAYVGLDRFRLLVEDVARRVVPGADVEIGENADEVVVTLAGSHRLEVPLAVLRRDVLEGGGLDRLRGLVRAHLEAYARAR